MLVETINRNVLSQFFENNREYVFLFAYLSATKQRCGLSSIAEATLDAATTFFRTVSSTLQEMVTIWPAEPECENQKRTLSEIIPVRSGQHTVRVRIAPDDATAQDDTISGDFARNSERDLWVSARHSGPSLAWQSTSSAGAETSSAFAWLLRYAGSLLLTMAGSIISALTGFAIKELPGRLRSDTDSAAKVELGPQ